jgi:hypothetical protein
VEWKSLNAEPNSALAKLAGDNVEFEDPETYHLLRTNNFSHKE